MIEKTCYFFNVGTTFDRNNLETLKDVWNCNSNCCKADLCNGLYCEEYGIDFDKERCIKNTKKYVESGVNNTYGFVKEVKVSIPEDLWDEIYKSLVVDYHFDNVEAAKKYGYIPFDYGEIIENFSSYWEEPDLSFFKDKNKIRKNVIHVLKESELNSETMEWVNKNLYYSKSEKDSEVSENEFENRLE